MINRPKHSILLIFVVLLIAQIFLCVQTVSADDVSNCTPHETTPNPPWNFDFFRSDPKCLSDPVQARNQIGNVISIGITLFIIAGAFGAFVMFVYGGFRYMTAKDDAEKTKKARDTMQYAAIGLVVMAMVYVFIIIYNNILPPR